MAEKIFTIKHSPDGSTFDTLYPETTIGQVKNLQTELDTKQDTISDLATIRSGAALGTTSLQPGDVINNVTTTTIDKPLSANMGKALQDQISNLQNIGRFLSIWNSSTGLPETNPTVMPYTYRTGDYYRVGTVAGTQYIHTVHCYLANEFDATITITNSDSTAMTISTFEQWLVNNNYTMENPYTNVSGSWYYSGSSTPEPANCCSYIHFDWADYFHVGNTEESVGGAGIQFGRYTLTDTVTPSTEPGTNYKPNGATYDGTASTTVETETVEIGAVYYYDGSVWRMQAAGGGGLVQDVQVNGTSVLSAGTGVANVPLASGSAAGAMSTSDYTKLSGVASGAQVNVLEGVQVNGTDLTITDKKVNIPMASNVTYGAVKIGNWGAGHDSSGLFTSPLTYSQYGNATQYNFVGKGTLENVLDNESVRFDKALTLSAAQKAQAISNIGAQQYIEVEF